jgi:signal transduction histidine kinase
MKENQPLRILIVDDSPEDRFTYRRLLTSQHRRDFQFFESDLGEEGLEACRTNRPDCVLLDYRLPDLDGVEFLQRLRTASESEVPIIVLTRQGNEEIAVQAMKAGAEDYLLKDSVSADSLCRAIEFAMEKAANRRERELRKQAEQANRMKDEFLATLSHEMRTPLNAILGWITLIRSGRLSSDRVVFGLEAVERNARTQARLIEDLLDVSRIISGKFVLDKSEFELYVPINDAIEVVRPLAETKKITLKVHCPRTSARMRGDPVRLQQAIWNLLSNAVKFTAEGGSVDVRLGFDSGRATLSVTDTGVGIPPEFLPYVFDRFRQADGSTTRAHDGLGLGLAIAQHIVHLHGGVVGASSEGRDKGSTFTIELPIRALDGAGEKVG